ncbi:MAG: OmpA family protein, partial [Myxococcota bacterium]
VTVREGGLLSQDLLVDPSGRIYNSQTGDLISGAEVLIYYADEESDPSLAGRLVAPEDLEPGQQGQLTRDGLYRFDVRPGRLYRIEVVSPSQALAFPSLRIPAQSDFWNPDDDPRQVVDNELPDLNGALTYFLRFNIRDQGSVVENNHIPLDSLSSLIQLDKRANKKNVTVGEVVTYTIQVVNRSSTDLLFDPAAQLGGVYIRDALPQGFDYVKGSGRVRRIIPGQPVASEVAETSGALNLSFGLSEEGGPEGRPTPLSLGAGETLELRYQLVAGVDVQPNRDYINRAVLVSADGATPLSNVDQAKVRVVYDPIFDQGIVIGKVFCDANGNGWQDEGDRGIHRARVYLDNGWYAVTDTTGKYHFQEVEPGNHLIKIDPNTLPPGSKPTTDIRRVFYTTRGLPTKINFAATCPDNIVDDVDVNESEARRAEREARRRARFVQIEGDLDDKTLVVEGSPLILPETDAWISIGKPSTEAPAADAPPPRVTLVGGKLSAPLVFNIRAGTSVQGRRWTLRVIRADAEDSVQGTVHIFAGEGDPPQQIAWDGKGTGGAVALSSPTAHRAELTIMNGDGSVARSAPLMFGVDGPGDGVVVDESRPARLFGRRGTRMTKDLREELDTLRAKLTAEPEYQITIEVHTDDDGRSDRLLKQSQDRASAIKAYLNKEYGIDTARIKAQGYGDTRPLVPNVSKENRTLNNRIVVRVVDPTPPIVKAKVPSPPSPEPGVSLNDRKVDLDADGTFSAMVLKPADGLVIIEYRYADGRSSVRRINARNGFTTVITPAVKLPKVPVTGNITSGTVKLGSKTTTVPLLSVGLTVEQPVT